MEEGLVIVGAWVWFSVRGFQRQWVFSARLKMRYLVTLELFAGTVSFIPIRHNDFIYCITIRRCQFQ